MPEASSREQPKHCYLFTLEVEPLQIDVSYRVLPLHCTLITRFWIALGPEALTLAVADIFAKVRPVPLVAFKRAILGPQRVTVSLVEPNKSLTILSTILFGRLRELGAEPEVAEWSGDKHIFHVTDRPNAVLVLDTVHTSQAVYLIEVKVPGHGHGRIVRHKFTLE